MQTLNAQAIRAFLRASTGDRDGAESDIATVRNDPMAIPQSLARASLAEAILLERSGDRDGLREMLLRDRTLLLQATDRRDRSIVRAYQRMLKTTATTPYRKPMPRDTGDPSGEEPSLADWMEKVLPGAAAYVSRAERQATRAASPIEPVAPPTEAARKAVLDARTAAKKATPKPQQGRFVMLSTLAMVLILFVVLFLAMGSFSADPELTSPSPIESLFGGSSPFGLLLTLLCTLFVGMVIANRIELRKQTQRLVTAAQWVTQGRVEDAEKMLAGLASHRFPTIAASACLSLALLAERRADLTAALGHCDRGLAWLTRTTGRIAASDILLPELIAERAFLLIAMDRATEAHAEMASLGDAFPYLARARFRTHLLEHIRRNNLAAAAAFAAEHEADLPLHWHDELLADAVRAAVTPDLAGAAELARIREEARIPEARRWLESIAPNVLDALEKTEPDPALLQSPAPEAAEPTGNAAAETETLAEEEAALAFSGRRQTTKVH